VPGDWKTTRDALFPSQEARLVARLIGDGLVIHDHDRARARVIIVGPAVTVASMDDGYPVVYG
jgi:hypothetical protein